MKKFRSLNYLAGVCLVLLLIASTLVLACSSQTTTSTSTQATSTSTAKTTTSASSSTMASSTTTKPTTATTSTAVPKSILECPQGPPPAGQIPQYGGTLKLIFNMNVTNLGAHWKSSTAMDGMVTRFAMEALCGLDALGNPVPQLATSWVSDPVKKTITFTLRQGVKFHDGTDFNAAAAKWNMDMVRSGTRTELKLVTSIDVIDDNHLRLNLSVWDPIIFSVFCGSVGRMASPTAAQKLGDAALLNPVGTGPFKFVSFQSNVSLKYTRFDGYWQKGLPYLDAVEISIVTDPVVALTSFIKGEAQAFRGIMTKNAKELKEKGYTIDGHTANILGICGDSKNPGSPWANINVRRAVAYALDNKTIGDSVYDNMMPSTNQLALPGVQAYDTSIKGYPYNPAKAQQLLAEAGYSTANPLKIKLAYMADLQRADFFTTVQSYLSKVGINITLDSIDSAGFTKLYSNPWNNMLLYYSLSYNGLEMQYSTSLASNLAVDATRYVSVWIPDDFNTLYNVMLGETDPAKREEYYKALNKMAVDDYCLVVPMVGIRYLHVKAPNLHDFGMNNKTAGEFLPERAWLSK